MMDAHLDAILAAHRLAVAEAYERGKREGCKEQTGVGLMMRGTVNDLLLQGVEPCELCSGFGRPGCPACNGTGWANVRAIKAEAALMWIAQQPCQHDAEGASDALPCSETGACVTEWCLPCYAKAALPLPAKPEEKCEAGDKT